MTLEEAYNFLNFWIGKHLGGWYPPEELDDITDRGQMAYFSDCILKYGTSQRLRDTLSPFKDTYTFAAVDSPVGVVTIPPSKNMLHFLDLYVTFTDANAAFPMEEVPFPNEVERTRRLRSQTGPVTASSPIGEWAGDGVIQLWPKVANQGTASFLRRPVKPNFVYSLISGRVIVYDNASSTNLEWKEQDLNAVLLKTLSTLGINLKAEDIAMYAEQKTAQNFANQNKT